MHSLLKGTYSKPVLFLAVAFLLFGAAELLRFPFQGNEQKMVEHSENILNALDQRMAEGLKKIPSLKTEKELHEFFMHSGNEKSAISYYIFRKDSLLRWSDNEPVLSPSVLNEVQQKSFLHLSNGWFYCHPHKSGDTTLLALLLLRNEFAYENKYLQNTFNAALELPEGTRIVSTGGIPFHSPQGKVLCYFAIDSFGNMSRLSGWLFLLSALCLFPGIFFLGIALFRKSTWKGIAWIVLVVLIRILFITFKIPDDIYNTDLFSPRNYASSFFFNSLGDLLINVSLLACFSFLFFTLSGKKQKSENRWLLSFGFIIAFLLISVPGIHLFVQGLVINSRISFDFSNLSELGIYTAAAFFSVALVLIAFFLVLSGLVTRYYGFVPRFKHVLLALFFSSVYVCITIWQLNLRNEQESRKLLAQKVDERQDHIAEYLFDEATQKITADSQIIAAFSSFPIGRESVRKRLSATYFTGYLGKFDNTVWFYSANGQPADSLENPTTLAEFNQQVLNYGKATSAKKLFYMPNESGRLSYLAILPVESASGNVLGTMVIQLNAKLFQSEEGFPELFMSGKYKENSGLKDYSFARYSKGSLIYEYGSYAYSFSDKIFNEAGDDFSFITIDGYSHLVFRSSPNALIIVSKPAETAVYVLTLFSWVFAFFSIVVSLLYVLYQLLSGKSHFQLNLTLRIQLAVVLMVVLSFLFIGTGTVTYIFKKYDTDQKRSISEQVNGLWFLTGDLVGFRNPLSSVTPESLMPQLNALVKNLNLDFNLYDEKGYLYYSSQPKIFEQNIVSGRMNPEAYFEMQQEGKTQYIHPENAGKLNYISAYAPFTDSRGNIIAYLNLPYFEKQNELNREISGFLSALINIYVLLFALSLLLTLFVSSRITQPLLLIQEKLRGIRLGKRNEQIEYSRKDEIGQLVQEYNRMIDELSESADKLAQSERESAWREMAKQVAHEIKNPLTPMKLSVQHVQMAWKENRPGKEEMIDRMANTIIQQIDSLSAIATEFSNFAKMPVAQLEEIQVHEILQSTIDLFGETPAVEIQYHNTDESLSVLADKDQLLRVFSNLLKNAIQSIPSGRNGIIYVDVKKESSSLLVSVKDNGIGIKDDEKEKIFRPNFTTKSSGTGLGLAMVKNIVENSGGKVWFTSTHEVGSTFFVSLPLA